MRITTIDDNVTLFEGGLEFLDELVDSIASFDKENNLARCLEFGAELFDGVSALDLGACEVRLGLGN